MKYSNLYLLFAIMFLTLSCLGSEKSISLDKMDLSKMECGWGVAQRDKSVTKTPLKIGGTIFDTGVGTHAISKFLILLNGDGKNFTAFVGVDDASVNNKGTIEFFVIGDQKVLWKSGIMKKGDVAKKINVDIRGIRKLGLLVTGGSDGIDNDHADWADARITYKSIQPHVIDNVYLNEKEDILTPVSPAKPRINGPKKYGVHPRSPFLYRIPSTGKRPMTFSIANLPKGLVLDKNTGIITGKIEEKGEYQTEIKAQNALGTAKRDFKIVVGNTLALTPSMGWNSWYMYYHTVSDSLMRLSADYMIKSGMADFGYQYINIDDCWGIMKNSSDSVIGGDMREKNGEIRTNKRFPDMKALTDYIHQKGLKAGIYSSPGETTCGSFTGSFKYERQDIQTFARWGFDFLKYDWCSYGQFETKRTREACMKPYTLMWDELQKVDRDIVFNLCQYGMANVWEWGGSIGNCWRTTGDLGNLSGAAMPPFYYIGLSNAEHSEYARPGAWNDPDYILVGWVWNAKTKLSPNEQYSYMSMWSLMAAPLIFAGDMSRLDPFTLNILCNHEVIDIDQDALGRQAKIIVKGKEELVLAKELEDGSKAVGLFHVSGNANSKILNLVDGDADGMSNVTSDSENPCDYFIWGNKHAPKVIRLKASDINIKGKFKVRDVWRQKDLGIYENIFDATIPYHGVMMLKISEVK